MPKRKTHRFANAASATAGAASDIFGNFMRSTMQQKINDANALRNDTLERSRAADNLIATGKLDPSEREGYVRGTYQGPSAERRLSDIMGGIDKAPTMGQVPSREALGTDFKAQRLPAVAFGVAPKTQPEPAAIEGDAGGAPAPLPSVPYGPTESPMFQRALDVRQGKMNAFPPEKTGSRFVGDGPSLREESIFTKWNPDLGGKGSLEEVNSVPAGASAGQKGSYEGQVAAETARQKGPVETANAVSQQAALMPGAIKQAGGEAAARQRADTQEAIHRATLSGGLLPEQASAANEIASAFQAESRPFWVVQQNFRQMASLSKDPTPAGSIGVIVSYMHMTDPNSIVTAGEQANATNAAGVPEQVRSMYNRLLLNKGRLTPEMTADFLAKGRDLYTSAVQEHQLRVQDYGARAAMRKIPAELVVREPAPNLDYIGKVLTANGVQVRVVDVKPDGTLVTEPIAGAR